MLPVAATDRATAAGNGESGGRLQTLTEETVNTKRSSTERRQAAKACSYSSPDFTNRMKRRRTKTLSKWKFNRSSTRREPIANCLPINKSAVKRRKHCQQSAEEMVEDLVEAVEVFSSQYEPREQERSLASSGSLNGASKSREKPMKRCRWQKLYSEEGHVSPKQPLPGHTANCGAQATNTVTLKHRPCSHWLLR